MGWLVFAAGVEIRATFAQSTQSTVDGRRAQLEDDLAGLEKEIEAQRNILSEKQREKVSLERDVAILDAQIAEAQLSIKARNLTIKKLGTDIDRKEQIIGSLSDKIGREKESLAQLIRKTNEIDSFSLVEVVLSNEDLSAFFVDLDSFDSIKASLQESFNVIETAKNITTQERDALEEKKPRRWNCALSKNFRKEELKKNAKSAIRYWRPQKGKRRRIKAY